MFRDRYHKKVEKRAKYTRSLSAVQSRLHAACTASSDMHYATFSTSNNPLPRLGAHIGDRVLDLQAAQIDGRRAAPDTLLELIQQGPDAWKFAAEVALAEVRLKPDSTYGIGDVRWHAPIPRPLKNVFCVGRNYAAHVKEGAAAFKTDARLPDVPVFFSKVPTTVNGPFDEVPRHAAVTAQMDWEAELGVIIGRPGRNIAARDALSHVFGYTVINDITARDLQQRHTQWFKGKSLDGSCPMGPVVVTADEFGDPQNKQISLRVNGVTKQDARTSDMIFTVATIIEWLSRGLTLEPGDIIATGTPEGVGMGRTPQEWLQDDDVVETEIEGIGVMRNIVRNV
jgi:2-keto-4-pentenoate hydratase/2-oxohepta-3-ene-1,7-dioic acid hydratase in catechol pathway